MPVIDWLLDSDPAIRWQVMRDLTDAPAEVVANRRRAPRGLVQLRGREPNTVTVTSNLGGSGWLPVR
jgi:hypothetical protein